MIAMIAILKTFISHELLALGLVGFSPDWIHAATILK